MKNVVINKLKKKKLFFYFFTIVFVLFHLVCHPFSNATLILLVLIWFWKSDILSMVEDLHKYI